MKYFISPKKIFISNRKFNKMYKKEKKGTVLVFSDEEEQQKYLEYKFVYLYIRFKTLSKEDIDKITDPKLLKYLSLAEGNKRIAYNRWNRVKLIFIILFGFILVAIPGVPTEAGIITYFQGAIIDVILFLISLWSLYFAIKKKSKLHAYVFIFLVLMSIGYFALLSGPHFEGTVEKVLKAVCFVGYMSSILLFNYLINVFNEHKSKQLDTNN